MPIREYHCAQCGHEFEVLEGPSSPTTACEACGSAELERLLSVFAAHGSPRGDSPCDDFGCSTDQCAAGACPMLPG